MNFLLIHGIPLALAKGRLEFVNKGSLFDQSNLKCLILFLAVNASSVRISSIFHLSALTIARLDSF